MNRETKMGLLVGLAFLIMIGILFSNHLSSTNAPLGADLKVAGNTLRSGMGEPSSDDVSPPLRAPQMVTPSQPIVTNEELNHHDAQPPVHFVKTPVTVPTPGGQTIAEQLRKTAQQQGEELVPVQQPHVTPPPVDPQPAAADQTQTARTYQAQSGDSLGAIAFKVYGSSCRANREAIVAANPELGENRDFIVAGQTYNIPALNSTNSAIPSKATITTKAPAETPQTTLTYVVKSHDTLWSIATNEVGTSDAVAAIKELNKSILNGSDRVRPNMKLRLPAKRVAMGN